MSKPNKNRIGLIASIKQLVKSVLFRKLTGWWSLLLCLLLIAAAIVVSIIIRNIYSNAEYRLAVQSIESVGMIRDIYLSGDIGQEGSELLRKAVFSEGNSTFCFFRGEYAIAIYPEGAEFSLVTEEPVARFYPYAQRVLESGELVADRAVFEGRHCIVVGKQMEYENGRSEVILAIRDVEQVYRRHIAMTAAIITGILLTLAVGVLIVTILTSRYIYPYSELTKAAVDMTRGDLTARAPVTGEKNEIGMLCKLFNRMADSMSQSIQSIEEQRALLERISESSTNGIAVTDENGRLIQANRTLEEFFGYDSGSAEISLGEERDRLALIPDPELWARFDSVAESGETETMVYPISGDRVLWVSISPLVSKEGRRMGVVGNFHDMTEVERLERTRRDYVANVSHELRRPLTALQGLLEPIKDGLVTREEDKQRYYDIMLKGIKRLTRLIADMMQLSGLQSGNIRLRLEPIDVSEIVADLGESYRKEIETRGLGLTVSTLPGAFVNADTDRVEQVLVILIDNAIRYNKENGSIALSVFRCEDERVCVSVADTGLGIHEEDVPRIFERFYKSDRFPVEHSTGLGLNIALTIMQKMGGDIICESECGVGTTMTMVFPAAAPEAEEKEETV